MATLFRCRTPTDRLCPCGRVARALRAHGERFTEVPVGRDRDEIIELTGQHRLPVLVLDGEAIVDSRRIVEHLEWRARG